MPSLLKKVIETSSHSQDSLLFIILVEPRRITNNEYHSILIQSWDDEINNESVLISFIILLKKANRNKLQQGIVLNSIV